MKKFFTLILLFLSVTIINAKTVTTTTALQVGANYLSQHGIPQTQLSKLQLVYTSGTGAAMFYVFSADNCFVMVSADDGVIPVLAYATNRAFHGDHIPVNVAEFLESYNNQINYIITNHIAGTPEIATKWDNLIHNKTSGAVNRTMSVPPLLNTIWNQQPYYNDSCPGTPGALAVTGCVATATAQVMKYWNWPVTGQGSHSYNHPTYGTLSADFGATTYNWGAMLDSITGDNPAIATLMYHVGVSVDMGYGVDESSAYVISSASPITNCAQYALKTYFNYNADSIKGLERSAYSDASWIALIENELNNHRPVIYTGFGSAGGHCFVADGYDGTDNFIHMNWGWGGYGPDAYYAIDALNPPVLRTGGGAGGFNSGQQAVIGIMPNVVVSGTYSLALNNNVNQSATSITYSYPFTDSTNVLNSGSANFTGDFCAAAFDNNDALIAIVDTVIGTTINAGTSLAVAFPTAGLLTMLPGTYYIGIFYRPTGGNWQIVPNNGTYTNFPQFTVTNFAYMELDDSMQVTTGTMVQGSPATVSLNVYDSSLTDFTGSYDVSLYDLNGNQICSIQTLGSMSLAASSSYVTNITFTTASVTAAPGTYLMALMYDSAGTGWTLAGSDFHKNPILVTVQAAPLPPDIYELNNSIDSAYLLPLTFTADVASASTPGSNINVTTDEDYYKIQLPYGYVYSIAARVNDDLSTFPPSDLVSNYSTAVIWSYSTDSGATWSDVYTDAMPGTIDIAPTVGDTSVFFHISPMYIGNIGTYKFLIENVTRTPLGVATVNLDAIKVFPNPSTDYLNIDFSGTTVRGDNICIYDAIGQKVYSAGMGKKSQYRIATDKFASGLYFVEIATNEGVVRRKISINR